MSCSVFSDSSFPVHFIQIATSTLLHCQGEAAIWSCSLKARHDLRGSLELQGLLELVDFLPT